MRELLNKLRQIITRNKECNYGIVNARKKESNKSAPKAKEKKPNKVRRNRWGFPVRGD